MKPKLSIVIPHDGSVPGANDCLDALLDSLIKSTPPDTEIIVVHNEGTGYGKAVNEGMAKAIGDYIIVANNDTTVFEGDLIDLCGPINSIYIPLIWPMPRDENPRCFFAIAREIYLSLVRDDGYFYDERFEVGYFEDDDLIQRLKNKGIAFGVQPSVSVIHKDGGGLSMKHYGEQKYFDLNKKRFEEKWHSI